MLGRRVVFELVRRGVLSCDGEISVIFRVRGT